MEKPLSVDEQKIAFEKDFLKAQAAIEAADKSGTNPRFNSKYSKYEDVVAAVKPHLNANNISYRHPMRMVESNLIVATQLTHAPTGYNHILQEFPVAISHPQEMGSGITYGKKYTLAASCGTPSDEDDDGNAATKKPNVQKTAGAVLYKATKDQKDKLRSTADKFGISSDKDLYALSEFLLAINCPESRLEDGINEFMKNPTKK